MADDSIEARVAAVEKLVKMFAFERIVYALATVLGFLLAFYATLRVLQSQGFSDASLAMLSGSGIMAASSFRIIKLFSDSLAMIAGTSVGAKG